MQSMSLRGDALGIMQAIPSAWKCVLANAIWILYIALSFGTNIKNQLAPDKVYEGLAIDRVLNGLRESRRNKQLSWHALEP